MVELASAASHVILASLLTERNLVVPGGRGGSISFEIGGGLIFAHPGGKMAQSMT